MTSITPSLIATADLRLADYCGLFLAEIADNDPRLWVIDGDLADSDGAVHFAKRHRDRFVMAGIAEQCMVSLAAGMAASDLRPWVFSFAAFLCYRAYDQVRVGLSQTNLPVTLVGSHSGGCGGRNGKTHQSLNDIALMASLPGIEIWAPVDPGDLRFAMEAIIDAGRPAYLRLPREPLPALGGLPERCRWVSPPAPLVLIGTGFGTHLALGVREELARLGLVAGVVHCAHVVPLPRQELSELLCDASSAFVIEDHYRFGGLADLIRHSGIPVSAPGFGWPSGWAGGSGDAADLLEQQRLAPAIVAKAIKQSFDRDGRPARISS